MPVTMHTAAVPDAWGILISPNPKEAMPELPDLCVRPLDDCAAILPVRAKSRRDGARSDCAAPTGIHRLWPKQPSAQTDHQDRLRGSCFGICRAIAIAHESSPCQSHRRCYFNCWPSGLWMPRFLIARDYVQITAARFQPQEKGPNRLTVSMARLASRSGPPSIVELVLPASQIPGLESVGGGATARRTHHRWQGTHTLRQQFDLHPRHARARAILPDR